MQLNVTRSSLKLSPDFKKVIPRFFNTGDKRSVALIHKILQMPEAEAEHLLDQVLVEFAGRYQNIGAIFTKHFALIQYLLPEDTPVELSDKKKLLLGSYFTMEYAIEAAALFNPSVVDDPDQTGAGPNEKNIIISFRATGESHISSLIFKRARLDENANVYVEPDGEYMNTGTVTQKKWDSKLLFGELLSNLSLSEEIRDNVLSQLPDPFSYRDIEVAVKNALVDIQPPIEKNKLRYEILSMVNTSYELNFPLESKLSERVIFPVTFTEKNGIEDARFVKFLHEDGSFRYIATYTAYDGSFILPHLIETKDFLQFKMSPLHGKSAINKNLALFPRKINGQYVMISRIDGVNNYIMFSDDLYLWETAELWQQPKHAWELVQLGNGGSPIETEKGWLVITHGVGPMRKYCLGASLFDLNDPTIELGRLKEPMLLPNEDERYGYVPNVVYTCGSMIHGDKLLIPYAVSDQATSFATIPLNELLDEILKKD